MKAAILTAFNEPLELVEMKPLEPKYGQLLVEIIASGICGAQLAEIRGEKNADMPLPRLMGHEAVVRVVQPGDGVKLREGDKAIAHWRPGAGIESDFPKYVLDGRTITGGRITTFSTHSVISENRLTAVPEETPDELCTLLGCALSTALGVIENEAHLKFGERILIIGCGGLGLNLVRASKLLTRDITVNDVRPEKMNAIWEMERCVKFIYRFLPEDQFDVIVDTSGNADAISDAISALAPSGRFIMVGQPKPGEFVRIPNARNLFNGDGCTIMATQGGRFNPVKDIPRYVSMHASGLLNIDKIITHRLKLDAINEGIELVKAGKAGRVLIEP